LGLQVSIRSIQHTDYIRNNPEEVIGGADIQLLIDQVNKLCFLEEIIHVLPQEFKIDGQSEIKEPIGCMVED
jgi:cell division protein FtsA